MEAQSNETKTRIVKAPQSGQSDAWPLVDNVTLHEGEEVQWIWTTYPDGRRVVTGYEIIQPVTQQQAA
jgi:hypothetical protein